MKTRIAALLLAAAAALGTSACTSPAGTANHPADHTVLKGGTYHKAGLTDPLTNCVSCHGADLKGGTAGVSCFSCHGQKW